MNSLISTVFLLGSALILCQAASVPYEKTETDLVAEDRWPYYVSYIVSMCYTSREGYKTSRKFCLDRNVDRDAECNVSSGRFFPYLDFCLSVDCYTYQSNKELCSVYHGDEEMDPEEKFSLDMKEAECTFAASRYLPWLSFCTTTDCNTYKQIKDDLCTAPELSAEEEASLAQKNQECGI